MATEVRTWHHGLVARWWAEFNHGGDDVAYFQDAIERSGQPALDAGCGTGRLLLPLLRAGLDVEGSDASADMLDWCRRNATAEGLSPTLHAQPMHALSLPRKFRTIVVVGAFGLGGGRAEDLEGLRRLRSHLEPGGTLVMDHHLPNFDSRSWAGWVEKPELPRAWPSRGDRRRAQDGAELELKVRQHAFDPLEQTTTLEIRAARFVDGSEVEAQTHLIDITLYFKGEIELMLAAAGFVDIRCTAALEARAPEPWRDERIVFHARAD